MVLHGFYINNRKSRYKAVKKPAYLLSALFLILSSSLCQSVGAASPEAGDLKSGIFSSKGPAVIKYSSDAAGSDDITGIGTTRLESGGSIYIHFDRPVRRDPLTADHPLSNYIKLYKIPRADETAFDELGVSYDKKLSYRPVAVTGSVYGILPSSVPAAAGPEGLENTDYLEEVSVGVVEILPSGVLKITPGVPLLNLNKYRLLVASDFIEGLDGVNPAEAIDFGFWTRAAGAAAVPSWTGVSADGAQSTAAASTGGGRVYTIYGAPQYGPEEPIVLNIDREVNVRAQEETIRQSPRLVRRITYDSLKEITLEEVYQTDGGERTKSIGKYELEYHFSGGAKRTRLLLYPSQQLEWGKYYSLNIPAGVFESRAGNDLGAARVNFTVRSDSSGARGIYTLENNSFYATHLLENSAVEFTAIGYNFIGSIDEVRLFCISGSGAGQTIIIGGNSVFFENTTRLAITIAGEAAEKLSKQGNTGTYLVTVFFTGASEGCVSPVYLTVLPKEKPEIIEVYPSSSGGDWYDEFQLNPITIGGKERYFLQVTFSDPDNTLVFNTPAGLTVLKDLSSVYAAGSEATMIDRELLNSIMEMETEEQERYIGSYLFRKAAGAKRAYLYIPVLKLRSQTTYKVTLGAEAVRFSDMSLQDGSNEEYSWSFATMAVPVVRRVSVGTVGENYDEDRPIIITGDLFYTSVRVYFNNERARRVRVRTDNSGDRYLEVYLPAGANRLEPGTYNIIVQNGDNHESVNYGELSVVKSGDRIPEAGVRVKGIYRGRDILENTAVSEDTITIPARYNDSAVIEIDLDDLVGTEVLVRRIKMAGEKGHTVDALELTSRWCGVDVLGLTLDSPAQDDDMLLTVGGVEPIRADRLKSKLRGRALKSELVQVTGNNVKFDSINLRIPLSGLYRRDLDVLRYDEATGGWETLACIADASDMQAETTSARGGIFVVVEK